MTLAHLRLEGSETTHELTLEEGRPYFIGRFRGADVMLGHPSVGRRAVRIEVQQGTVYIEDLGSGGGSSLDGVDRPRKAPLRTGAKLSIGDVHFHVVLWTFLMMLGCATGKPKGEVYLPAPVGTPLHASLPTPRLTHAPSSQACMMLYEYGCNAGCLRVDAPLDELSVPA